MEELSSAQLSEWEAYDRLDPVGEWRGDFREARLESLLINIASQVYRDPKKPHPKLVTVAELMPKWGEEQIQKVQQSVEEMKSILMAFAESQNKRVKKEQKKNKPPKR